MKKLIAGVIGAAAGVAGGALAYKLAKDARHSEEIENLEEAMKEKQEEDCFDEFNGSTKEETWEERNERSKALRAEVIEAFSEKKMYPVKTIQADIFIIPNSAGRFTEYFWGDEEIECRCQMLINNDITPKKDTLFIEGWIVSNEESGFKCDNLCDHIWRGEDGTSYNLKTNRMLPAQLFKGVKEGDVVHVVLPVEYWKETGEGVEDVEFMLTCKQQAYRYRRHGNFEDVFERVCAAAE